MLVSIFQFPDGHILVIRADNCGYRFAMHVDALVERMIRPPAKVIGGNLTSPPT